MPANGLTLKDNCAYMPPNRKLTLSVEVGAWSNGVRDVIVEGRFSGGVLRAHQVMTSCPSKYEAGAQEQAARPGGRAAAD